jgi:hypothetical protein
MKAFEKPFVACAQDPDQEHRLIDNTTLRAHPCATGAPKNHGPQTPGRSKSGPSTKLRLVVEALGNGLRFRRPQDNIKIAPKVRP